MSSDPTATPLTDAEHLTQTLARHITTDLLGAIGDYWWNCLCGATVRVDGQTVGAARRALAAHQAEVAAEVLSAVRADERARITAGVMALCESAMRGATHRGINGNYVSVADLYVTLAQPATEAAS